MNASQLALAVESIEGDCDTRNFLKVSSGKTCAVGGLAESAGIDPGMWNDRLHLVMPKVRGFYGFSPIELRKIMRLNDKFARKATRVKHIVKYLNSLELE